MTRLIRSGLLSGSLLYFSLCIVAGLEVSHELHQTMIALFVLLGFVVIVRYLFLIIAAIHERLRGPPVIDANWHPPVSIIVPAFNEERLISGALASLIELDYPDYEIIVVDDGSTDGTACIARQIAERHPACRIRIISQSNAGKSWALNTGLIHAQGDFIVCVDADSRLNADALKIGMQHFRNPRVGAVGGYVDVINCNTLITQIQQLEYVISQNFVRRALSFFDVVTVVPGPIGLFRKEAIAEVGAYSTAADCFAEDADLTVRLLARDWLVQGEPGMVAYTEAPTTLFQLLRQRYRWKRGLFQAFFYNFRQLYTASAIKPVMVAGILCFETFVFDIANFGITLFALASFLAFAEFNVFLWAFALISLLDIGVLLFANLGQGRLPQRLGLFLLQKMSYAYVLQAWGVLALFDEWLSARMDWDKLERTGGLEYGIQP